MKKIHSLQRILQKAPHIAGASPYERGRVGEQVSGIADRASVLAKYQAASRRPGPSKREGNWRSGVCAFVKQPIAVFCGRKLLMAVLTCGYYARRSSAANDGIFGVAVWAVEALT